MTPAVDTPASAGLVAGPAAAAAFAIAASMSFSVMKPRLSIVARSMPWRSASSTALFVAFRSAGFADALLRLAARERGLDLVRALRDERDRLPELDLDPVVEELHERPVARRLDLDGRLRRLDDAHRLPLRDLGLVLDEPLGEQCELRVRVLARQDDLEHRV